MPCYCVHLRYNQVIAVKMSFFYIFVVFNIHYTDSFSAKEVTSSSSTVQINKLYFTNGYKNDVKGVDTLKYNLLDNPATFNSENAEIPTNQRIIEISSISTQKVPPKRKQQMQHTNFDVTNGDQFANVDPANDIQPVSGLIQTIRMDLQPDRDNFLPLNTNRDLRIDHEKGSSYPSSASPYSSNLAMNINLGQHLILNDDNDNHPNFIDEVSDWQGLHQKHKLEIGPWQQRLYSNVGDKISTQYIL